MAKTKAHNQIHKHQPPKSIQEFTDALSAPFDLTEVRFKPAVVSGNRALALAYVDARAIQDRLDAVLGVLGWQDSYRCLEDGSVVCRLRLRLGDEWVTKVDVGSPSDQGDAGDRRKAAFSDALKRAAVKFGIGRYLYRLPAQWVDYDNHKKQFLQTPRLPAFALPRAAATSAGDSTDRGGRSAKPNLKVPAQYAGGQVPANGEELTRRLTEYDAKLARQGLFASGDLIKHVVAEGIKAGHTADLADWSGGAILFAADVTRAFEAEKRSHLKKRKEVA